MSSSLNTYGSFFKQATAGYSPYPYQESFAVKKDLPQVLSVPTGIGKTATVILGWLYRRRYAGEVVRDKTPRRLVYCLPMRTLVEQTQHATDQWLQNLELNCSDSGNDGVGLHLLMGGVDESRWDERPEQDAILIGTQDMLLSRALNRGYGMSRYRWPVHFALLNNDSLWVLDETQLMGVGLTTSSQLQGFREKLDSYGTCQTLWMSATLNLSSLQTVDHSETINSDLILNLKEDDLSQTTVKKLVNAKKTLHQSLLSLNRETKNSYDKKLAEDVVQLHQPGTITLVVLNRVNRTQHLYQAIEKLFKRDKEDESFPEIHLIHSRFRPAERSETQRLALDESTIDSKGTGRIVIATQAIEAGVDLSATTLISELSPWSSMVQRFGRCNRRGTCGIDQNPSASVHWIDIETNIKDLTLPYEADQLELSREHLLSLEDVGPVSLKSIVHEESVPIVHVLRKKDLLDLFDTTPDLAGNDLDVSRYIRDSQDTDLQLYWREDWSEKEKETPDKEMASPDRNELCSVPVSQLKGNKGFIKKILDKGFSCYSWNGLDGEWEKVDPYSIRPGMTLLIHREAGGYDDDLGWTGEFKNKPSVVEPSNYSSNERMDRDDWGNQPLSLEQHLCDVAHCAIELREKLSAIDESIPWKEIITSAWWHDVGKAHVAFQTAMQKFETIQDEDPEGKTLWAKSGGTGFPKYGVGEGDDYISRKGFRHELASALAWLSQHESEENANLIAYLIAAHHGKVRMSIRSMPNEIKPKNINIKFARGIWDGDVLPEVSIGNGEVFPGAELNLDIMQLGESESGQSWLSRTLELRDQYGPFKLAYLEAMVRVSDWLGSKKGGSQNDK